MCLMFYVYCSDVIVFNVELEEGHVDQWLITIKQRIISITAHLVIFHAFFEGSNENTLLELLLKFLTEVDILGFNCLILLIV